ncbi:MAG: hypothetical protein LBL79_12595 [Prevotella sp.]|jgi:hypothetical protein|nr:hypothetical protein [Prevotella sp.]
MSFSDKIKLDVWKKAISVQGFDSQKYRKDPCGAWMIFDEYGNHDSIYGWDIDHIYPQSLLGKNISSEIVNHIDNLRAMQWENNNAKGDDYPVYSSIVSSDENKNVYVDKSLTVNETIQESLKKLFNL